MALALKELESIETAEAKPCAHHWIIDGNLGAESTGVCRRCGATKVFSNHLPGDRYAKEWRETRIYATVSDRRVPAMAASSDDEEADS